MNAELENQNNDILESVKSFLKEFDIKSWPKLNNYLSHDDNCYSHNTEICTCGLMEAKERGRLSYSILKKFIKDNENLIK